MEDVKSKNLVEFNSSYIEQLQLEQRVNKKWLIFKNLISMIRNKNLDIILLRFKKRILSLVKKNTVHYSYEEKVNKDTSNLKVAIFSCISGKYDKIREPLYISDQCDYFLFTDLKIDSSSVWKKIDLDKVNEVKNFSDLEKARFIKTHPHLFFNNYDYSIWIDGNLQIVGDLLPLIEEMGDKNIAIHAHPRRKCLYEDGLDVIILNKANKKEVMNQLNTYKKFKFPEEYGLFETNLIIRQHNNQICKRIMEDWWSEIDKFTKRDQLSFTYVLWKNKFTIDYVHCIGSSTKGNPRVRFYEHPSKKIIVNRSIK